MLIVALTVVGVASVAVIWHLAATSRVRLIPAMALVVGLLGLASVATGRVHLSPRLSPAAAILAGIVSGAGLYLATVAFVRQVRRWARTERHLRWSAFDRHVDDLYDRGGGLPLWPSVAMAALVVAPAEEAFWRGLLQGQVAAGLGWPVGALVVWLVYVAANVASRSLPILAGAVVCGAAWSGLALWTRGVLAGAICHVLWTGLMILRPP